ncbi:non-homologous end-joining DNA ligase [Kitasatospora sp. A2-31]|uniref:non-homologous end-joining DNA ligase n=1 Tax=Kitasatospora sp. A2-31 TaxID=2916414 RepID=UPI0027E39065|nr:non-homologous end-joining DNA ligase [Kitasatospora sp. A2-31]
MPQMVVDGRTLALSHLDKVYYPRTGTPKGEVLRYYAAVHTALLPHLHDRPVSFLRCPDGVEAEVFIAKNPPAGTPRWVRTVEVPSRSGELRQVVLDDGAALLWAANLGCLELHVPQWHATAPGLADRLVLDLDPGEGASVLTCRTVAVLLRERLTADGLDCWVKTSGSKGLHLLAPIVPTPSSRVSGYAKALAASLEAAYPELVVHTMAKARRAGRVFVDWSQNSAKKTTAAPYTLRARPRPTVSTPVSWAELEQARTEEDLVFTLAEVPGRLAELGDLLAPLLDPDRARPLPGPEKPGRTRERAPSPGPDPTGAASAAPAAAAAASEAGSAPAPARQPPARTRSPLVLEPPVEVMRPAAVTAVPPTDGLDGSGVLYELKLDGFRCVAFARGERPPYLQSRSGRDLAAEFPPITAAVARLPAGLVLDAELVAWREGRFAFEELLRTRQARAAESTALGLIAFDVLALPGRDVRQLPLADRRRLLLAALADVPPPIQPVMATTDRVEALTWMEQLADTGVEGLVCKAAGSAYRPRGAGRVWVKYRRSDTLDATVRAVAGSAARPEALVLELDDGRVMLSSPRLTPVQAGRVAEAVHGRLGRAVRDPEHGSVRPLTAPLRAEVTVTGRPPMAAFVRLRGD